MNTNEYIKEQCDRIARRLLVDAKATYSVVDGAGIGKVPSYLMKETAEIVAKLIEENRDLKLDLASKKNSPRHKGNYDRILECNKKMRRRLKKIEKIAKELQ